MNYTGSLFKDLFVARNVLPLLAAMLLSSCASMQQDDRSSTGSGSSAAQPAQQQQPPAAVSGGAAGNAADSPQAEEDPGINRTGRVIQLGRFAEDRPQVEVPEGTTVELNYEQEELRLVFEELGDQLQINMVIDPTIDDRVSLRSSPDNPLLYEDLWPLMRMLARNAQVTIEQAGNVYRFMKNNSTVPTEIVMPGWLNDATASEVLQVTPLTYISVESALQILNPVVQPEGSIIRLGQGNLIGISGSPEQLERVNAFLDVIDDDPFQSQGIHLYELLNSQAAEVSQELTNILGLIEGQQSSYQVLGLERINAVLVIAPANRGFEEVTRWMQILDADSQEQVEQLFFYKVKNLNAATLAQTLSQVFEQDEENLPPAPAATSTTATNTAGATATTEPATPAGEEAEAAATSTPITLEGTASDGVVSANISVTIVADEDTNSLLVRSTPRDYRQLLTTINNLDTIPPQVLINAVIGQVTLSDRTEFGVNWTQVISNLGSGSAAASTRFLPGLLTEQGGLRSDSGFVFNRSFQEGSAMIDATLNAIAQDNDVRLLARPTILATNNQEGEIKVGQAVPVNQGASTSGNGVTVENIVYRDVGIVMTITPHINADGFINLEIFQSLSSIEEGQGVGDNPVFSNQEITTTAVVSDQSVITLGGLIQELETGTNQGVPIIRKVPVLGGLFSYQQDSSERRELFIILRPEIINGDERDSALMQEFRNSFEHIGDLLEEAGL